jgi:hypothetical protein
MEFGAIGADLAARAAETAWTAGTAGPRDFWTGAAETWWKAIVRENARAASKTLIIQVGHFGFLSLNT